MRQRPAKAVPLPIRQATCLRALGSGKARTTDVAVAARLSLNDAREALQALRDKGLIRRASVRSDWILTDEGRVSVEEPGDEPPADHRRPSGPAQLGGSGERLLDLLDRPMTGREIARALRVSRERVRQLVVKLMALGRARVGDPDRVTLIVARAEDPSLLLPYAAERVLSSLHPDEATLASYVASDLGKTLAEVTDRLAWLTDQGLVRENGRSRRGAHWALTEAGAAHPQYRSAATKARLVPLPVKSDRVRQVLSHLADHGPARIRDLRDALHIQQTSINALIQYLKRKGLVRKTADDQMAPLELTPQGLETQQAMVRRAGRRG